MLSAIHFFLLADFVLGSILIFLWLIHRSDRHALFWGAAQIMLGIAGASWSMHDDAVHFRALLISSYTLGLLALLSGTQHFCNRPHQWGLQLSGWGLFILLQIATDITHPKLSEVLQLVVLSLVFSWCAWLLQKRRHAYSILSLSLGLRAINNLALAESLYTGSDPAPFFVFGFIVMICTTLGMIYAVLHETDIRVHSALNALGHGYLIHDADGKIRFANQNLAEFAGYRSPGQLLGRHVHLITATSTSEQTEAWFRHVTSSGAPQPCIRELTWRRADGHEIPVETISAPYEDRGQICVLTQFIDIHERKEQEAARQRSMMLDETTGLFNRNILRQLLSKQLANQAKHQKCMILMIIDIDHFRRINDTLGHSVGDKLLARVAQRLKTLQGPHDILARLGGDEFAFVISDIEHANAQTEAGHYAQTILHALSTPFPLASFQMAIKASIGIACSPEHGLDPESLLSAADVALYAAKNGGRDQWLMFTSDMVAASRDALLIDEALQQAIPRQEFHLLYQPIVDAHNHQMVKVEALLRWNTPILGSVSPDRFIPIAEKCGQINEIGSWVLQEAARQAERWKAESGEPIRIAINVSALQLVDPDFLSITDEILARSGADPSQLEIEVTERVLIDEADTVVKVIEALHSRGLSTSLDDFGTGYSSLSYLTRFHLRTLKIDRTFVSGIEDDARNLNLVRAIIAMGHSLGMQIIAEGVETAEQARILAELGCEYLQGYLFSKPLPAAEISPLISPKTVV